jgi:2-dehydropantoate 2-reductase
MPMRVGLIGAGAVGAVIAQKIQKTSDFFLIVDENRRSAYEEEGIIINGERVDFEVRSPKDPVPCDLLIYAVKNYQMEDAIKESAGFVKEGTILFSLLNGVVSETLLEKAFPEAEVLYAFITGISSNKEDNRISCFRDGTIYFGDKTNRETEAVKTMCSLFEKSGLVYSVPSDIHHDQWWKFMLNTCYNTLSAILLTPYSKIYDNDAFIRASRMVCAEVLRVASAERVNLDQEDVTRVVAQMRRLTDDGKTSMLQDMEAGRRTENDYFAGTVINLGQKHGIPTPVCSFLYQILEAASYARA